MTQSGIAPSAQTCMSQVRHNQPGPPRPICASSEEPGAVVPHAGICEGGRRAFGVPTLMGKILTSLRRFPWYPALMSIDQIAPEALKLPVRERALLAASLWESIEDPFELPVDYDDEAALNLAEKRDQEIESGRVQAVSHQDLMQRLRQ